jgi:hypothetical protein
MSSRARPRCAPFLSGAEALAGVAALGLVLALAGCTRTVCCVTDGDCADAALCFEGMCRPRCSDSAQCAAGEHCTGGACVATQRRGNLCPFDSRGLDAGPASDGGGPGLDAGFDAGAPGSCVIDSREPNDEPEQAIDVFDVEASICPARDDDYWLIEVPPGATVHARAVFEHDRGDIDMELLGPAPNWARIEATSQTVQDVEEIIVDPTPGEYVLHVFGFANAVNEYELTIDVLGSTDMCVDDELEDNDSRGTATTIDNDDIVFAVICPGDDDFYRFNAFEGALVEVELYYDVGEDLRLEVRRPGQGILGDSATASGFERVTFNSSSDGPVSVEVSGAQGVPYGRGYELFVSTLAVGACADEHEPNEGIDQAVEMQGVVNSPTTYSSTLCPIDLDTWRFEWVGQAMYVQIDLEADESISLQATDLTDATVYGTVSGGSTAYFAPWSDESGMLFWVSGDNDQEEDLPYAITATPYFLD